MTCLDRGNIQLKFDPIGGRIISLRAFGEELLFSGEGREAAEKDLQAAGSAAEKDWRAFKRAFGFRILGGDKTWIAPEKEWHENIPPLDLDAGRYREEVSKDTVTLTSPDCRETGLRIIRSIRLDERATVHVREEIVNVSNTPVTRGIWNVSQVPRPFVVYFPGEPERFRSYYKEDPSLTASTVQLTYKDGMTGIPCALKECYKFGGIPAEGRSVLMKPVSCGSIRWERHFDVQPGRAYAHRSAVEVFNSHLYNYGEVEIHSPLYTLAPGEKAALEQAWVFYKCSAW